MLFFDTSVLDDVQKENSNITLDYIKNADIILPFLML